jgi:hypothetical protein
MVVSFVFQIRDNRTVTIKFFFSALESAKLFTPRRAAMLQHHRVSFEFEVVGFCWVT